jgi:NAD(P)-dependent dehydrogenase (short-subunit alcohol dehydrogenase family)
MPSGSAVIIGSGPGIGRNVAAEFASRGFTDIALLARRKEQLEADTKFVLEKNANANVKTYEIDVTDLARLKSTLEQVGNDLGTPEFVFFNAARVQPSTLLEASEEEMSHEFTVSFFFFFFFFFNKLFVFDLAYTKNCRSHVQPCMWLQNGPSLDFNNSPTRIPSLSRRSLPPARCCHRSQSPVASSCRSQRPHSSIWHSHWRRCIILRAST